MKNLIKPLSIIFATIFIVVAFSSCSKNDDPVNNNFFAGTYVGSISYVDATTNISNTTDGKVFVTKIGNDTKYNFAFSDNIPNLRGIDFRQEGDHILVSTGATSSIYIRIDNSVLKILYIESGKTWTANCTR